MGGGFSSQGEKTSKNVLSVASGARLRPRNGEEDRLGGGDNNTQSSEGV